MRVCAGGPRPRSQGSDVWSTRQGRCLSLHPRFMMSSPTVGDLPLQMNRESKCGSKRDRVLGDLWEDARMETIHADICSKHLSCQDGASGARRRTRWTCYEEKYDFTSKICQEIQPRNNEKRLSGFILKCRRRSSSLRESSA